MGQFMEVGEGGGRSLSRGILGRGGGGGVLLTVLLIFNLRYKNTFLSFTDHRTSVSKLTPFSISKIGNFVIKAEAADVASLNLHLHKLTP